MLFVLSRSFSSSRRQAEEVWMENPQNVVQRINSGFDIYHRNYGNKLFVSRSAKRRKNFPSLKGSDVSLVRDISNYYYWGCVANRSVRIKLDGAATDHYISDVTNCVTVCSELPDTSFVLHSKRWGGSCWCVGDSFQVYAQVGTKRQVQAVDNAPVELSAGHRHRVRQH